MHWFYFSCSRNSIIYCLCLHAPCNCCWYFFAVIWNNQSNLLRNTCINKLLVLGKINCCLLLSTHLFLVIVMASICLGNFILDWLVVSCLLCYVYCLNIWVGGDGLPATTAALPLQFALTQHKIGSSSTTTLSTCNQCYLCIIYPHINYVS